LWEEERERGRKDGCSGLVQPCSENVQVPRGRGFSYAGKLMLVLGVLATPASELPLLLSPCPAEPAAVGKY